MKITKRVFAIFMTCALAMSMMITMSAVSFAADGTHTISVKSEDTHTYRVFQVLTGTLAEEGSKQLGNPAWGADAIENPGDVNAFITSISAEGLSDQDIAQLVAAKVDTTGDGQGTVKAGTPLEDLATGYYVLVDVTDLEEGSLETKALHVVKVVNDINGIDIKWDTTWSGKTIVSDTLGNGDNNLINGFADNVSIGDTVKFEIGATVPDNANLYNYFYFVINDTLDPGLTLKKDSIKVSVQKIEEDHSYNDELEEDKDYLVKTDEAAEPYSFKVGMVDAKSFAGKMIVVSYSAVLNDQAQIGENPNKNTQNVTFSNDPNHDYNGENYPGFPDKEDLKVTGETPENITRTYTTGIEIQKVDQDGNILTGAEFTIKGNSTEIVLVSSETFTEATDGEYYGLKDGTYTKTPPVTADYMKEAPKDATKGYVIDANAEGEGVVTIGGTKYRPYREGDTGTVYILVKANADKYNGKRYNKTVTYIQKDTTGEGAVEASAVVGPDGVVRFVGLGAGKYTITETKTPAGYNTLDPVEVEIKCIENPFPGKVHWDKTSGDATYNPTTGVFEMRIVNQKGSELPETGGIGTMIFYILGSLFVVGCGIVLVSRRRMENK